MVAHQLSAFGFGARRETAVIAIAPIGSGVGFELIEVQVDGRGHLLLDDRGDSPGERTAGTLRPKPGRPPASPSNATDKLSIVVARCDRGVLLL